MKNFILKKLGLIIASPRMTRDRIILIDDPYYPGWQEGDPGFNPTLAGAATIFRAVSEKTGMQDPSVDIVNQYISQTVGTKKTIEWSKRIMKERAQEERFGTVYAIYL